MNIEHIIIKKATFRVVIVGVVAGFLASCMTDQMYAERVLTPKEKIPSYRKDLPFICKAEAKEEYSPFVTPSDGFAAFLRAEALLEKDVSIEEKIIAYEKAVILGYPLALERILQIYQFYNLQAIEENRLMARRNTMETKKARKALKQVTNADERQNLKDELKDLKKARKSKLDKRYDREILTTYRRMIEQKLPLGYAYLAELKQEGKLVQKDEKRAFDYMYYASSIGNARAQSLLGDYYSYTQGSYKEAQKAYSCAASQGNKNVLHSLALSTQIFEKNYPQVLKFHIDAAENGSMKSLIFLRSVFRDGLYGYEKNFELTKCLDTFITTYKTAPEEISGVSDTCILPDHPELGDGTAPLTKKQLRKIARVERKFNPERGRKLEEEKKAPSAEKEYVIHRPEKLKRSGSRSRF